MVIAVYEVREERADWCRGARWIEGKKWQGVGRRARVRILLSASANGDLGIGAGWAGDRGQRWRFDLRKRDVCAVSCLLVVFGLDFTSLMRVGTPAKNDWLVRRRVRVKHSIA